MQTDTPSDLICMCVVVAASERSARRPEEEETDSERKRRARVQDGQNRNGGRSGGCWYERMLFLQKPSVCGLLSVIADKCACVSDAAAGEQTQESEEATAATAVVRSFVICHV